LWLLLLLLLLLFPVICGVPVRGCCTRRTIQEVWHSPVHGIPIFSPLLMSEGSSPERDIGSVALHPIEHGAQDCMRLLQGGGAETSMRFALFGCDWGHGVASRFCLVRLFKRTVLLCGCVF